MFAIYFLPVRIVLILELPAKPDHILPIFLPGLNIVRTKDDTFGQLVCPFDLLALDGRSIIGLSLEIRKTNLAKLLTLAPISAICGPL
jgi:hypothetical protein